MSSTIRDPIFINFVDFVVVVYFKCVNFGQYMSLVENIRSEMIWGQKGSERLMFSWKPGATAAAQTDNWLEWVPTIWFSYFSQYMFSSVNHVCIYANCKLFQLLTSVFMLDDICFVQHETKWSNKTVVTWSIFDICQLIKQRHFILSIFHFKGKSKTFGDVIATICRLVGVLKNMIKPYYESACCVLSLNLLMEMHFAFKAVSFVHICTQKTANRPSSIWPIINCMRKIFSSTFSSKLCLEIC